MAKRNNALWMAGAIVGGLLVVILLIALWVGGTYNTLVTLNENVDNKWAFVESAYQRRADLIPNLVSTVKAYSDYEGSVLTEVTAARSAWTSAKTQEEQIAAANQMESALSRLLVVVENYPNLKANENYLDLQVQLEGTENRINVERNNFNNAVRDFNVRIKRFPTVIIAGMFGFAEKEYFEAKAGADEAPDVGDMFNR